MNQHTPAITRTSFTLAAAAAALLILSACVPNKTETSTGKATTLKVESTATECVVSAAEAPSGTVEFEITNSADQATEFYLLAEDGKRVVGEAENIAPGAPRKFTAQLKAGDYFTLCKPGMVGDGVGKAAFTVTDSATK